ncbi:MAG: protein kinase [Prevotella sp.]|nr:protein kinase [Prevotella sp.]
MSESFFTDTDVIRSSDFTDVTVLPSSGYSLLVKARRYGRWWLLKGLKEDYRNQTIYQVFLQKEYDILCQMQHPMVVSAFSFEPVEDLGDCIVMEWIEGITLKQWLQTKHKLSERRNIADMLTDVLTYVHHQQTEHRDLKPSNVMVTDDGHYLKLIDFGLSDTKSYAILKEDAGTEGYMAPDGPSDIYSLGCILRELHLGLFSNLVIRHCLAPSSKRINNVTAVKKALHRCWLWPRRVATILLAAILLALLYRLGLSYSSQRLRPEIMAVQTTLSDSLHRMQVTNQAVTDSLQQRIVELETEKQEAETKVQQREEIIQTIQHAIDQKVRALGIEQILDTVSSQAELGGWVGITEQKIQSFTDEQVEKLSRHLSQSEQSVIKSALQEYLLSRYTQRWEKRSAALPLF